MLDHAASSTATQIAQNSVFERFARAGYVVSGLLHLTIGYLAIRIALGSGGNADQSGALAAVAAKPGGIVALWIAVLAFFSMALWRLVETALGRKTDPKSQAASSEVLDRVKALALAVVYLALASSTFGFARGAGKSTGAQNSGISARLMQTSVGTIALIAAGVVIVAVGGYHVYKGANHNFVEDLEGRPSDLVRRLGTVGYIAKGLTIAGAGVLVVVAATRSEPNNATGLDGALKTLGAQPYGAALLIAAGLGISTYGLLQLRHGPIHQNVSESGDSAADGTRGLQDDAKNCSLRSAPRAEPPNTIHDNKEPRKGLAMSEKWGISRVGKPELEVGETLQEAIIRLQILPLPPVAWTDCFLETLRGHQVTITGTENHPDKIEAVARPAEVEEVLRKIDSAIENANKYVEKVVHARRRTNRDVKKAAADDRRKLQAELDQLAEKLAKPEYAEATGPE